MSTFHITYHGQQIAVSQESPDIFLVALPEKKIQLQRKEDNEGADHWFEQGSDNETEETAALGTAIEVVLAA